MVVTDSIHEARTARRISRQADCGPPGVPRPAIAPPGCLGRTPRRFPSIPRRPAGSVPTGNLRPLFQEHTE